MGWYSGDLPILKYSSSAPKFIVTDEMRELYDKASDIDEEVRKLRGAPEKWLPLTKKTYKLYREAGALYNEYYKISAIVNKEYYKYWDTDMSHLIEVIEVDSDEGDDALSESAKNHAKGVEALGLIL